MRRGSVLATGLLAATVLGGCAAGATSGPGLTVFAAASLRTAMEAVAATYEAEVGVVITVATDSSAALATQIELGARADVFLSADTMHPAALVDAGLTDGEAVAVAGNELAIIVPSGNPAGIKSPADLGRPGVRVVAAGEEVPISRYATELLAHLADLDGYPGDIAAAYADNVVSREDNVAAVVAKIELGEGDVAIVYRTDAAASDGVEQVPLPSVANVRATYAGVVIGTSPVLDGARQFLRWLVAADGQAVLADFGFVPPPS